MVSTPGFTNRSRNLNASSVVGMFKSSWTDRPRETAMPHTSSGQANPSFEITDQHNSHPLPKCRIDYLMSIEGPNNQLYEMNSRRDLVRFVQALQDDLEQHPEEWENRDLHTFLGALARFLGDAHGYYRNANIDVDADVPSWRLLADCLQAASAYD
jgi:hypothetical protein